MEMGFAPALTNESCRLRPVAEPKSGPVVMSTSASRISISGAVIPAIAQSEAQPALDGWSQSGWLLAMAGGKADAWGLWPGAGTAIGPEAAAGFGKPGWSTTVEGVAG
jgi:hypothetical protein